MSWERKLYTPAICNRCTFLGRAPAGWSSHHGQCNAPVQTSAIMRKNGVKISVMDRLISNNLLVGLDDTLELNMCGMYMPKHKTTPMGAAKGATPTPKNAGLTDLLKPFTPEAANGT